MDNSGIKETGNKSTVTWYCGTSNVELPVPNKSHFPVDFQEKAGFPITVHYSTQ